MDRPRAQAILAVLLLADGRPMSAAGLIDAVWGEECPDGVVASLRSHVVGLRKLLEPDRAPRSPATVLTSVGDGYRLRIETGALDAVRADELAAAAENARVSGDPATARELLTQAVALWRGEPLAGLPGPLVAIHRSRLAERRLVLIESRLDLDIELGDYPRAITELTGLCAEHPLRERLQGLLMTALYHTGRRAEALSLYGETRRLLVTELGIEPGTDLADLHQRMLRDDLAPAARLTPAAATPRDRQVFQPTLTEPVPLAANNRAGPVPRELPAPVAGFTGRAGELAALTGLLDRSAGQAPPAIVISAIGGTAGVGKTALAVQWAHQATDRFPDGHLYVNLRGYDLDQPMSAADALARFLRALGVGGQDIPSGEDERAARYRSLLAGKKLLVVLDNAGSVEQTRPLLPGTPTCVVVVTSRDSLAGLVARHGATRLELDLLPAEDAAGLLRGLIGQRVDDDPGAAATLAGQCCRLPLALRVAAELAAARPGVPLADLVAELADQQQRLDLLDAGGDPRTAVRAVFSWSYRHLDPSTARAFHLAGLHPGPDFDPYAAAALTDTTLEQARTVLDALTRAHLIGRAGPGRYGMHDLLRAYARELTHASVDEKEQDAVLTRLFDHYLHTASTAMDTLDPHERHRRPRIPLPDTPAPPVTEPTAARAWMDTELANLVAVTVHAAGHSWASHATRLAATLFSYLDQGGHYSEAITIYSHARAAAQRTGDRGAEAVVLHKLAGVHWRLSRYQDAADHLWQALVLFRQTGDRAGQARALASLGIIYHYQDRYQEAIGLQRQILPIFREIGDLTGQWIALTNLGLNEERQGRYDLAARHYRQALAIATGTGARSQECAALINLGSVGIRQDRYRQAVSHLQRALALSREIGYRGAEADALARTDDLCLRQGRPDEATTQLREALALYREIGDRPGEADALNSLGEVLLATGQPGDARAQHAAALALAAQFGNKYQQARAHHGLGQASHASGDPDQARRHWQQALALFTGLGTPEAEQVRAQLAAAQDGSHRKQQTSR